ncbi:MAG: PD-(D/E)XK nuclease family protein [Deltaproteobacteria bacterium]|jgi:RecB family exonuclease|nr:PD-(D/E)XK nuclease family protein [Deltaproteobacteria bacterium]
MENNDIYFLGWNKPFLHSVAEHLIEYYQAQKTKDSPTWLEMQNAYIVLPSESAKRRLLELLVQVSEQRKLGLIPPNIITIGKLVDLLIADQLHDIAHPLECKLFWAEALKHIQENSPEIFKILSPKYKNTKPDSLLSRLNLAEKINSIYYEISTGMKQFQDVPEAILSLSTSDLTDEINRWVALNEIYQEYLKLLKARQLTDRHQKIFETVASNNFTNPLLPLSSIKLWLAGTTDLNENHKQLLNCLQDKVAKITTLIFANPEYADYYDNFGSLQIKKWQHEQIHVTDEQLNISDNYQTQAAAICNFLKQVTEKQQPDQIFSEDIVIGIADQNLRPFLEDSLKTQNISFRSGVGLKIQQTKPLHLLKLFYQYWLNPNYDTFAALLRHPDLENYLTQHFQTSQIIEQLIEYQDQHLQENYGTKAIIADKYRCGTAKTLLINIKNHIQELGREFNTQDKMPLSSCCVFLEKLLNTIYPLAAEELTSPTQHDLQTELAINKIQSILKNLTLLKITETFLPLEGFYLIYSEITKETLYPVVGFQGINLLGWLEIPLDDTPLLALSGFNEGYLPESVNEDAFLPNALRQKLGILDDTRRLAREIATFKSILESRKQNQHQVFITCSRTVASGHGLPSRLLFIGDKTTIASRIQSFFSAPSSTAVQPIHKKYSILQHLAQPLKQDIKYINITSLADFVNCPYRFYLQHILKLKTIAATTESISDSALGSLAHSTLEALLDFKPETQKSTPALANDIYQFLIDRLETLYFEIYAATKNTFPLTLIQKQILEEQLRSFSHWQAKRYQEGWIILETELKFESSALTEEILKDTEFKFEKLNFTRVQENSVAFTGLKLRGRIDRVDYNPQNQGKYALLDYKTGDNLKKTIDDYKPQLKKWTNFQLPAYALAYQQLLKKNNQVTSAIELGYLNLTSNPDEDLLNQADWSAEILASAGLQIKEIVASIISSNNSQNWEFKTTGQSELDNILGIMSINLATE